MTPSTLAVIGIAVALIVGGLIGWHTRPRGTTLTPDAPDSSYPPPSNPWEMMREVMAASGQELPDSPTLNKTMLLYVALIMEESAETALAAAKLLMLVVGESAPPFLNKEMQAIANLRDFYYSTGRRMQEDSEAIRAQITLIGSLYMPLDDDEAQELFDGVTDTAVVTCGLALAAGLPGAEGYAEVQASNLSKRNPATGIIDKTADGKWIKGRDYFRPDLGRVLEMCRLRTEFYRGTLGA